MLKGFFLRRRRKIKNMNNKMAINAYLSKITLNANGLNVPIKRHTVVEWITKQDPYMCCPQVIHFRLKTAHRLKVNRWERIFHENEGRGKLG